MTIFVPVAQIEGVGLIAVALEAVADVAEVEGPDIVAPTGNPTTTFHPSVTTITMSIEAKCRRVATHFCIRSDAVAATRTVPGNDLYSIPEPFLL